MLKKQKGFTVVELVIVIFCGSVGALLGLGVYAAVHFIIKCW
jgi:prepilin-type N-terminal cleavage/methylation domain-containing protein